MIKILANDGIHADGKLLLEDAGYELHTEKIPQDELPSKLNEYDVIIVRSATKVRKDLIDQAPNLKIIARAGVGLDNIDVEYAQEKGIKVINTPAASSLSVAELVFAHIFSIARFLNNSHREMPVKGNTDFKKLKKAYSGGFELKGKTLGIVGLGRIGREAARIGLAMGMKVLAADPMVDEVDIEVKLFDTYGVTASAKIDTVSMKDLLKGSDIITLHVPGGQGALIGKEELDQMKDGIVLVNAARGGVIDETVLLEGLESGKILAAGLDVFEGEPTPKQELLEHPRISVSPHIGASTNEAQANIGRELADKIIEFFQ
ncbi:D-2-hydroxyacid dehydrogenase [Membranihabitans maritimus]|uniref:D-2-hydroxyacid dehydrogenase n=1 Tax=Membranihabitans maritimus TaxID=2904244 RepID=UPI001F26F0DD|nr:D-2-hydroxyacid dehydrogenase [Membranihabitans maritimus]